MPEAPNDPTIIEVFEAQLEKAIQDAQKNAQNQHDIIANEIINSELAYIKARIEYLKTLEENNNNAAAINNQKKNIHTAFNNITDINTQSFNPKTILITIPDDKANYQFFYLRENDPAPASMQNILENGPTESDVELSIQEPSTKEGTLIIEATDKVYIRNTKTDSLITMTDRGNKIAYKKGTGTPTPTIDDEREDAFVMAQQMINKLLVMQKIDPKKSEATRSLHLYGKDPQQASRTHAVLLILAEEAGLKIEVINHVANALAPEDFILRGKDGFLKRMLGSNYLIWFKDRNAYYKNATKEIKDKLQAADAAPTAPATNAQTEASSGAAQTEDASGAEQTEDASGAEQTADASGAEQTKDASGAEQTKDAAGAEQTKDASGAEQTKDASGAEQTKDASGAEQTEDASGAAQTEDASGAEQTKDASGAEQTKDASGAEQTKDASGAAQTEDASGAEQTKDASGAEQTKDASGAEQTKDASGAEQTEDASGAEQTADASGAEQTEDASGAEQTKDASGAEQTADASGAAQTEDASGAEQTEDASGAEQTEDASGAEQTKDASGAEQTKDASGAEQTKDASGAEQTKDASGAEQTKDASGAAQTKDASGAAQTKDASGAEQTKDASGAEQTKDASGAEQTAPTATETPVAEPKISTKSPTKAETLAEPPIKKEASTEEQPAEPKSPVINNIASIETTKAKGTNTNPIEKADATTNTGNEPTNTERTRPILGFFLACLSVVASVIRPKPKNNTESDDASKRPPSVR